MQIRLQKEATTTPKVRATVQASGKPTPVLAARYGSLEDKKTIQ